MFFALLFNIMLELAIVSKVFPDFEITRFKLFFFFYTFKLIVFKVVYEIKFLFNPFA